MSTVPDNPPIAAAAHGGWRDFLELTKPKVGLLIVFTAVVGMVLASPGWIPLNALILGSLGIALASGSAAAFNHILDRRIDGQMNRTRRRPLPAGHMQESHAVAFAVTLALASISILWAGVNGLTAVLTFCSLIGYAIVYTMWLKRATPQNIVICGGSRAAPPPLRRAPAANSHDPTALGPFPIPFSCPPP